MPRSRGHGNNGRRTGYPGDDSEMIGRPGNKTAYVMPKEKITIPRVVAPVHRVNALEERTHPRRARYDDPMATEYVSSDTEYEGGDRRRGREQISPTRRGHDKRRGCSHRLRLFITLVIVVLLMGLVIAITAVTAWPAVNNKDTVVNVGTYETNLRLASRSYTEQLADVSSTLFKSTQEEICSATKTVFDGAISNCVVDAFSNGSLLVQSTLDFDLDQLATLVKKRGFDPGEESTIKTLELVLPTISAGASVKFVRKEPTFLTFQLRTKITLAQTNDSKTLYCKAMRDVYGDSLEDCDVTTLGSNEVTSSIRFKTKVLKTLARKKQLRSDRAGIAYVVKEQLANNTVSFFSSNNFSRDQLEVDDMSEVTTLTVLPSTTQTSGNETMADGPTTGGSADATRANSADVTTREYTVVTVMETTVDSTAVVTTAADTTVVTTPATTTETPP